MKNELNNFKVEELEQRLEMKAQWTSTTEAACTGNDCSGTIGVGVTFP